MKTNNNSKKNYKHSNIEKNDAGTQLGKGVKKDKSSKKRLSIYDEFDDEPLEEITFDSEANYSFDSDDDNDD